MRQTPQQIVDRILELPDGERFQVLAPVVRGRKGTYETLLEDLAKEGFARAIVDGDLHELGDDVDLARYEMHTIQVVVDRLVKKDGIERRLTESIETALGLAEGVAEIQLVPKDGEPETIVFSQHLSRPSDGKSFEELAPRNFSFNSPYGACPTCDGLGSVFEVDPELVVPDPELSLEDGAIAPWSGGRSPYYSRLIEAVATDNDVPIDVPWEKLKAAQQKKMLLRRQGPGHGPVQEPVRPAAQLQRQVRGHHPVPASGATKRSSPTTSVSRSRATCGRCRAGPVVGPASTRCRWR